MSSICLRLVFNLSESLRIVLKLCLWCFRISKFTLIRSFFSCFLYFCFSFWCFPSTIFMQSTSHSPRGQRLFYSIIWGLYNTRFLSLDEQPIAAASIAQVHRAMLKTNQEVAIKVCQFRQYCVFYCACKMRNPQYRKECVEGLYMWRRNY